jgi:hypothetical protein
LTIQDLAVAEVEGLDETYFEAIKLIKKQKVAGRLNYILACFYLPATKGDLLYIYSES